VLLSILTIAGDEALAIPPEVPGRRRLWRSVDEALGDRVAGVSGSPLSRRGALRVAGLGGVVGALGAGSLSACDLDPSSSSEPRVVPSQDPDQHLVDAARAELRGLIRRLSATGGTASLVECHRQQLRALQGDPPATTAHRQLTRAQVAARERQAADRFTHWALTARNGDLARVLASVAAGIRMQPVLREPQSHDDRAAS
jgi:hypothetical protein